MHIGQVDKCSLMVMWRRISAQCTGFVALARTLMNELTSGTRSTVTSETDRESMSLSIHPVLAPTEKHITFVKGVGFLGMKESENSLEKYDIYAEFFLPPTPTGFPEGSIKY